MFLFIHHTKNIKFVLKSGCLLKGSYLDKNQRKLSGGEPQNYIFMNIYFSNIYEKIEIIKPSLVFSSKLLNDYDISFNNSWTSTINDNSILIKHDDYDKIKKQKLKQNSDKFKNFPVFLNHEIIFEKT